MREKKTTGEGLATLIIARIFDFIIISICFLFLFFLSVENFTPEFQLLAKIGVIFVFLLVILLIGLLFFGNIFLKIQRKYMHIINFKKYRMGDFITKKSEETIQCFEKLKFGTIKMHISVVLLSLGIWIVIYVLFYCIALSMNIHLGWDQILFASSFAIFSTALPIQGIGGFGTMEGGWALGFIAVGASKEIAINTGFGLHLIILLYTIIVGFWGYGKIYYGGKVKNRD